MYTNDPNTNPSDAQVIAAIDTLNRIYNGTFRPNMLNTDIQFKLALRDLTNNCTTGITRTDMTSNNTYVAKGVRYETSDLNCGISEFDLKSNRWNPEKYLNIWLVNKVNNNGQNGCPNFNAFVSSFPNYDYSKDGVVINFAFITNQQAGIQSKATLAHEIGHYLGLYHVFEDNCEELLCLPSTNCYKGDRIDDTQPVFEHKNLLPQTGQINFCILYPYDDYTERNLMSYTTESYFITPNQNERINNFINDNPFRNSLVTNNMALISPIADLIVTEQSIDISTINIGNPITLNFREKNIGSQIANTNFVNFYLSTDNILTPNSNGDYFLGQTLISNSINPNTETPLYSTTFSIPNSFGLGTYYLFYLADGGLSIQECNELNNSASTQLFIVAPTSLNNYKYWFDSDFANAQSKYSAFSSNNTIQENIPVQNLSDGVHSFNIFFKGSGNNWSSIVSSLFYKQQIKIQGSSKHQYWFDENFGNAKTTNISSTDNYILAPSINITSLTDGIHSLNSRFRINGISWSIVTSSLFYKVPLIHQTTGNYQYWFDNNLQDTVTTIISYTDNLSLITDLNVSSLSVGQHILHIRFKPDGGTWSVVTSETFNKNTVLPITLVSFAATQKNCNEVNINWKTATELNNKVFKIEKSFDGINFIEVGSVQSTGNSTNLKNYNFSYSNFEIGILYFRLKQIDINGTFTYSTISKIKMNCSESISIQPNPNKGKIKIVSNNIENFKIQLFNSKGQLLKTWEKQQSNELDISEFPAGLYLLKLNEKSFKIIKE